MDDRKILFALLATTTLAAAGARTASAAPVATADNIRAAPGTAVTIPVLANDTDIGVTAPEITTPSVNGTTVVNGDGTVTFTPNAGYAGTTTFQYRLNDGAGTMSADALVTVTVRPLKRVVFLLGETQNLSMQYFDGAKAGNQARWVSGNCGLQSPTNPSVCQRMWRAPDNSGFIFQGHVTPWDLRPQNERWLYVDNTDDAVIITGTEQAPWIVQLSNQPVPTDVRFGPTGAKALTFFNTTVSGTSSSRATLTDFRANGAIAAIHDTTGADEVRIGEFSPDGSSVFYRTNTPATTTNVTLRKVAIAAPLSPTTLIGPLAAGTNASKLHPTPDGSLLLYVRTTATESDIRAVETNGSTVESAVGPVVPLTSGTIPDFVISPSGRYVAFVTNAGGGTPAAYVADLQTGTYAQIGSGFTSGTTLSLPKFKSDSSQLLLGVSSSSGSAIYEAVVTAPGTLTRVSALYAAGVAIPQFEYAGASIVYVADATTTSIYELFVASGGTAARLSTNLGITVGIGPGSESFRVSSDGTTVAYSQVDPDPVTPLERIFLIDVTTPGLPTRIDPELTYLNNFFPERSHGHLPKSLGFDFYL